MEVCSFGRPTQNVQNELMNIQLRYGLPSQDLFGVIFVIKLLRSRPVRYLILFGHGGSCGTLQMLVVILDHKSCGKARKCNKAKSTYSFGILQNLHFCATDRMVCSQLWMHTIIGTGLTVQFDCLTEHGIIRMHLQILFWLRQLRPARYLLPGISLFPQKRNSIGYNSCSTWICRLLTVDESHRLAGLDFFKVSKATAQYPYS